MSEETNHPIEYSPENIFEVEEMLHQRFPDLNEKEIKAILIGGVLMDCFESENDTVEEMQYDFISLANGYINKQPEDVRIVQGGLLILQRAQERKEQ
ncbi:hypothetical protein TRFO_38950 [Tritrichomonas foetus]|uniref:Uncharacterized protein n=1 Tax=Tritrichomonas foetus TaxID=1144522 RepID=A0A1J4J6N0_9EUKA|nr:hypothetical protein TRFO_38950 [Tritrichomonas foetus]|eukprot:OHS94848.1 hypothetical protein TRFO_38950 [Tritrichomonas foetus]